MKKILALVLALVMTLSLATISSGAAYSDADKVQYVDAVNAMSALGVMGGYADGSIRPQADVTRGAAAKMVAMVATGSNTTVIGYYAGTSTFADVPATHTFADAVAYCVGKGIVDGYGDGTYGVGDNVKGWAIAKMCLVAMGYDAEAFGLTGSGAALRTIELATTEGLFAGMKADFKATDAASREECAQIIFNALEKPLMVESGMLAGTPIYGKDYSACLLNNWDYVETGVVVANKATGADYTMIAVAVEGEEEAEPASEPVVYAYTNETGLDMIGHTVLFADTRDGANDDGAWTAYALVDLSSVVTVADGEKAVEDKDVKALFGANSVAAADDAYYFANYAAADEAVPSAAAGDDLADGTYILTDGVITAYMAPATFDVTYVADYTAVEGTTDGVLTLGNEATWVLDAEYGADVSFYAEIAEGDAVAVQQTGELYTVTKLATASGKLTKITETEAGASVTVGGKVYAISDKYDSADLGEIETAEDVAALLLTDVVLYLDINGAVVAIIAAPDAEVAAKTSVVYVVDYYDVEVKGTTNAYGQTITADTYSVYAQVVDMNGKEASLLVAYGLEEAAAEDYADTGLLVAVENYDSTNKVTYFTFVDEAELAEGVEIAPWIIDAAAGNDAGALKIAANAYFASDVKYIFVNADEADMSKLAVEVKTGAIAVPADAEFYATQVGTSANYSVKYVVVAGEYQAPAAKADAIVYVAADSTSYDVGAYTDAEGNVVPVYTHNVYINGVAKDIVCAEQEIDYGFYSYSVDANGVYTLVDDVTNAASDLEVSNLFGTLLTVGEMEDLEAKGAKIVDVYYAANSAANAELKPITTLAGLVGATVDVVYDVDATNAASSFVTIYVVAQPEAEA